jgi:D-hydroxyproline dehydrogenase subunit gamma
MPAENEACDLRTAGIARGKPVNVFVDGKEMQAYEGETVLAALWVANEHTLHITARLHEQRGFFCGIGICFDCIVTIDGRVNIRACLEPVRQGMKIERQQDPGYTHAR